MPQYLLAEAAEATLKALGDALDLVDVGIILLDRELHVRFINRHQAELFALSPALLARRPRFRELLEYAGSIDWFPVNADELPGYLDQREAAINAGSIAPTQINLRNGKRLLFSCVTCPDGGRILTYADISGELQREATEAVDRVTMELRFQTETLEDQAAYLASLAEAADESARNVEEARLQLERKMAEHELLETELRHLAATDGLTGALNRTGFFRSAQEIMDRTSDHDLAVLMLDIDHFKAINDRHGHAAGDAALQHLVAVVRTCIRQVDLFGRVGGEEFALILLGSSADTAAAISERLRKRIAEQPVTIGEAVIQMTVSIGVATPTATDNTIERVIARADAALYQAKRGGRNRVVSDKTAG